MKSPKTTFSKDFKDEIRSNLSPFNELLKKKKKTLCKHFPTRQTIGVRYLTNDLACLIELNGITRHKVFPK